MLYIMMPHQKGNKEFQFYCTKQVFEQLTKDVLSKHQLKMLDKCPACGQGNIDSTYFFFSGN